MAATPDELHRRLRPLPAERGELDGRVVARERIPTQVLSASRGDPAVSVLHRPGRRDLLPLPVVLIGRVVLEDEDPFGGAGDELGPRVAVDVAEADRVVVLRCSPPAGVGEDPPRHLHLGPLPDRAVEPEDLDPADAADDHLVHLVVGEISVEDVAVVGLILEAVEIGQPRDEVRRPVRAVVVPLPVGVRAVAVRGLGERVGSAHTDQERQDEHQHPAADTSNRSYLQPCGHALEATPGTHRGRPNSGRPGFWSVGAGPTHFWRSRTGWPWPPGSHSVPRMEPRRTIRCRVCGQRGSADARFCARCGARLPAPPAEPKPPKPPEK